MTTTTPPVFKLILDLNCVNSQISGYFLHLSVLQKKALGLPESACKQDSALRLVFEIMMSEEQMKETGLEKRFWTSSKLGQQVGMRTVDDVERIAIPLSKLANWGEGAIGGCWVGRISYSPENVLTLMSFMDNPTNWRES